MAEAGSFWSLSGVHRVSSSKFRLRSTCPDTGAPSGPCPSSTVSSAEPASAPSGCATLAASWLTLYRRPSRPRQEYTPKIEPCKSGDLRLPPSLLSPAAGALSSSGSVAMCRMLVAAALAWAARAVPVVGTGSTAESPVTCRSPSLDRRRSRPPGLDGAPSPPVTCRSPSLERRRSRGADSFAAAGADARPGAGAGATAGLRPSFISERSTPGAISV